MIGPPSSYPSDFSDSYLEDLFILEGQFLGTRSAEAFKVRVKHNNNAPAVLWALRHPLSHNSTTIQRFAARMGRILEAGDRLASLVSYGVDKEGTAFAALDRVVGEPVTKGTFTMREALMRFHACVSEVALFHRHGLVLGDLCGQSFLVSKKSVHLVGVLGTFDSEATATAAAPPLETIPYMAPEQRTGAGIEEASDLFALGVLGYFLLSKQYPYGEGMALFATDFDLNKVAPLASIAPSVPGWAEEAIRRALDPDPSQRFAGAEEMISFIEELQAREVASKKAVPKQPKAPTQRKTTTQQKITPVKVTESQPNRISSSELKPETHRVQPRRPARRRATISQRALLPILTALAFALVLGVVWSRLSKEGRDPTIAGATADTLDPGQLTYFDGTSVPVAVEPEPSGTINGDERVDPGTRARIAKVALGLVDGVFDYREVDVRITDSKRPVLVEELAKLDSPAAFLVLFEIAQNAKRVALRWQAEKALLAKASEGGLGRAAEQVRQWLRAHRSRSAPAGYSELVRSLYEGLPIDERRVLLEQAGQVVPEVALLVSAAMALDLHQIDQLDSVVVALAARTAENEEYLNHSAFAAILAHPELALRFGDDAIPHLGKMPQADLIWLMRIFAEGELSRLPAVIDALLNRETLGEVEEKLLELLRETEAIPQKAIVAMVNAIAGEVSTLDVRALSEWKHPQAFQAMVVLCATSANAEVTSEIFRYLATDNPQKVAAENSLFAWVISGARRTRTDLMQGLCALGAKAYLPGDHVERSIGVFDQFFGDSEFQELVIAERQIPLIERMLDRAADKLEPQLLLDLLVDDHKPIRIAAIRALKDIDQLVVLKRIKGFYEREYDQDVKRVYEENFDFFLRMD